MRTHLVEGKSAAGAVVHVVNATTTRRVVATRAGRYSLRLAPGLYQVEEPDGARALIVGDTGGVQWGKSSRAAPERVPGFVILAEESIWPGGVERWMQHLGLLKEPPCLGIAFARNGPSWFGPGLCISMLREVVPVEVGLQAVGRLARTAAVVVDWRCKALRGLLPTDRASWPRIIRVSHSPAACAWAVKYHRDNLDFTDTWVAVSASAACAIPASVKQVNIIPNAIGPMPSAEELEAKVAQAIPEWGLDGAQPKLVCLLSRFGYEKRPGFGLSLARALPPDWKVLIGGLGVKHDELAGQVMRDPCLRHRVIMPGAVDPWTAIALSRAVVVPSEFESFCRVIAEAWLMGKPVAATPVGLAAEHPAWVYPIGKACNQEDAADVAAWLQRGAPMAPEMIGAAQHLIASQHRVDDFKSQWSALIQHEIQQLES